MSRLYYEFLAIFQCGWTGFKFLLHNSLLNFMMNVCSFSQLCRMNMRPGAREPTRTAFTVLVTGYLIG